jgi:hypothetical protein
MRFTKDTPHFDPAPSPAIGRVEAKRRALGLGYRSDAPDVLESDLRGQHLSLEVTRTHDNAYGVVYEIVGPIGVA